jgi:hypothetical protein
MRNLLLSLLVLVTVISGFTPVDTNDELVGVWVRRSDHLRIRVEPQRSETLYSFIVEEGTEKFPCDVDALPIYKNITKTGRNLWSCDFLVVTMGSCSTEYESGVIRLTKEGDIEITCPGFEKKYYSKLKPRLDSPK